MKPTRIPMAEEGYPFILFAAFCTLIFAVLHFITAALLCLLLTGFICWFFRDPVRIPPPEKNAVISPADGKIILVERMTDDRFADGEVYKLSIFMNVFNVHVNRIPFSGRVERVVLRPGRFYSADSERGALHNEYCAVTVATRSRHTYTFVQVAGLIARRIVCRLQTGDQVIAGERFGLIRFGSRVDLYLPPETELAVRKGEKVRAGETLLGILPEQQA